MKVKPVKVIHAGIPVAEDITSEGNFAGIVALIVYVTVVPPATL